MNLPVRCLIITQRLYRSGVETFIMNVLKNINREKLMFDFYLEQECRDGYYEEALSLGCRIFIHIKRRRDFFAYKRELNSFFKEHSSEYKAVYLHGNSFTCISPIDYAKKYGVPLRITHCHSSTTHGIHNILFHMFNRSRIKSIANVYYACSEKAKVWGYKGTLAFHKCEVIKNGIDLRKYAFNRTIRAQIRDRLKLDNHVALAMVGRLSDVKNPSFALDIIQKLKSRFPKYKLLFIGDGELHDSLNAETQNRGLQEDVIFLGSRDDVHELMQGLDVLLMPSHYEGLPFVLVEAQASGLPVIASSNISKEVKFSDKISFLKIDNGVDEWVEAILNLCLDRREGFIDKRLLPYDISLVAKKIEETIINFFPYSNCKVVSNRQSKHCHL